MSLIVMSTPFIGSDSKANENVLENLSKHCRYGKRKRSNALEKWNRLVSDIEQRKLTPMRSAGDTWSPLLSKRARISNYRNEHWLFWPSYSSSKRDRKCGGISSIANASKSSSGNGISSDLLSARRPIIALGVSVRSVSASSVSKQAVS